MGPRSLLHPPVRTGTATSGNTRPYTEKAMPETRVHPVLLALLAVALTLAGCGAAARQTTHQVAATTPGASATAAAAVPAKAPTDTPEPAITPARLQLVILHTNDNWGETEPCG